MVKHPAAGILYGDIGTSPLYTYASTFLSTPTPDQIYGVCSIIFWQVDEQPVLVHTHQLHFTLPYTCFASHSVLTDLPPSTAGT